MGSDDVEYLEGFLPVKDEIFMDLQTQARTGAFIAYEELYKYQKH